MVQFFETKEFSFGDEASRWQGDPLSHPAIFAMTLEQVADLPFDPFAAPAPQAAPASWTPLSVMLSRLSSLASRTARPLRRRMTG